MPLIIKELITHVETPQDQQEQPVVATGAKETEQKVMEQLVVNHERQQRLNYD